MVIVHGSGTSDRSNAWTTAYANGLVARGIAVLHPDKRGSGKSTGTWQTADFLVLADDAVAGVEWLRGHPRAAAGNVGVIGFSQGGHVVPAAAARSEHVAFVIDVSGSTVPIHEQVSDEVTLMAERAGLSSDELAIVANVQKLGMRYAHSGEGWDGYATALAAAKSGRLGGMEVIEGFPTKPDAPAWRFARLVGEFDPMDYWKQVKVPVVFVYGGRDTQVRVAKSVRRILDLLDPLELNYTLMVFGHNGHALYREDQLDLLARWIKSGGQT